MSAVGRSLSVVASSSAAGDEYTFTGGLLRRTEPDHPRMPLPPAPPPIDHFQESKRFVLPALMLASLAYKPNRIGPTLTEAGRQFKVLDSKEGFISFNGNRENPVIIVAFRGSKTKEDWAIDGDYLQVSLRDSLGISGKAHRGFLGRYLFNQVDLFQKIPAMMDEHRIPNDKVTFVFTGHSLGGAIAHLALVDFRGYYHVARFKLITASSPRVFCSEAAAVVRRLLEDENNLRIWRKEDIVPSAPLRKTFLTEYEHVGTKLRINETYKCLKDRHDLTKIIDWIRREGIDRTERL